MGKVLVVDDEAAIRDLLADVLSEEGHQVLTARDGLEALDVLRSEPPLVVLLDLMMPRLDGRGVIREMETTAATRAHRVIVMSAAERLFAYSTSLQSSLVCEQVAKPFELETMIALVNKHMPAAS